MSPRVSYTVAMLCIEESPGSRDKKRQVIPGKREFWKVLQKITAYNI